MPYGRYFEDFVPGEVIKHWPGRTITETENTWFSMLTHNNHPLHTDRHYTATYTQHGQPLVVGTLVLAIASGQTVPDISGHSIANLDYQDVIHHAPVFPGDSIYTESTILDKREASKGDRGILHVQTRVTNQREELVMTFRRHVLIAKKNHATLGEGKLPG